MTVVFTAVQQFDPNDGGRWRDYIQWSGLTHLREVVSLDILLCPNLVGELVPEDWEYNVHEDFKLHLFRDAEYICRRTQGKDRVQILALMQNPAENDFSNFAHSRFQFRGFDLVELQTGISALVNCGGFDNAFVAADLSDCGLLPELSKALEVQKRLRTEYPDEHHVNCDLWAIWKMGAVHKVI